MDALWYRNLGARIARLRNRAEMTQERLAEKAGVGASYIARIETGTRRPTLDVCGAIADGLDIPLHRLIADERAVRAAESQEAWGKAGRNLSSIVLDLNDADINLLLTVATRLRGR
jgi:transcriptional regulator with XRE-family HTH domain